MLMSLLGIVVTAVLSAADAGPAVVHLTAADVDTKLASSGISAVLARGDGYQVMMAQRTGAGEVEVHATDTDVIRVVQGRAVFVTGGRAVDPKTTAPGEIRAPSLEGGEERHVAEGDVLVVPAGTPHWFKSIESPIRYFVVKVAK